jgi:hypothetical protein
VVDNLERTGLVERRRNPMIAAPTRCTRQRGGQQHADHGYERKWSNDEQQ